MYKQNLAFLSRLPINQKDVDTDVYLSGTNDFIYSSQLEKIVLGVPVNQTSGAIMI